MCGGVVCVCVCVCMCVCELWKQPTQWVYVLGINFCSQLIITDIITPPLVQCVEFTGITYCIMLHTID